MIITLNDTEIELLPDKAIWLPRSRLLCVADLHFEKASSYEARATFLPPYGSLDTLERLEQLITDRQPAIVIAAGDSFHDKGAAERMPEVLRLRLNKLVQTVENFHWLSGNHDVTVSDIIHGQRGGDLMIAGITFRHQTAFHDESEISGHYHPKARLVIRGHSFTLPCFVRYRNRLILPSFGQYTGGLDIHHAAFTPVAPVNDRKIFIPHQGRVFAI